MPTESYYVVQRAPRVEEYYSLGAIAWVTVDRATKWSARYLAYEHASTQMMRGAPDCIVRKAVKRTVEKPGRSGWAIRSRPGCWWSECGWSLNKENARLYPDAIAASRGLCRRNQDGFEARCIEPVTLPGEMVTEWTVVDEFEEVEDGT
jgi:hypothetical protein